MTRLEWAQASPESWRATLPSGAVLTVRRLAGTGEWIWSARFPDGRQIAAQWPYLTRGNAQAGAQHAAVRDA